ncbi:serine/threonine-protein kinase/endoribonuclease IRE1a-like isoform X1 [Amaranthus tricolor]|uniref:serine/threonine-protein kinase/endoribonuclease IRE1a-like isoform X1 n=2 Tax=Amaranthus tricolor TaxID=29722 RepID=UPI002584C458|nr:serine/threonine-protein kinase/endoribonuclease IRE1a-like isoform X1 [Amaranthus tricolor]
MKLQFLLSSIFSIIIAHVCLSISSDLVLPSPGEFYLHRPAARKPLSLPPEQDFELVVAPNGIVYMVDTRESDSRKVMWSISSGPPIYKSYQAPVQENNEKDKVLGHSRYAFLECGDDWELYLNHEYGKVKLELAIQDYVQKTPIYEDDGVTVGSMHSKVFRVDFWTGRLIYDYEKSVSSKEGAAQIASALGRTKRGSSSMKASSVELYIERIDYSLSTKVFDKLVWNLTVGFFKTKVRCRGTEHLLDGASFNLDHKLGSGSSDALRTFSLPCEIEVSVRRFRKQETFESFLILKGLPDKLSTTHQKGVFLPTYSHLRPSREVLEIERGTRKRIVNLTMLIRGYIPWILIFVTLLLIGFAFHHRFIVGSGKIQLDEESILSTPPVSSNKKRSRKPMKNINAPREDQHNEKAVGQWLNLNSLLQGETEGHIIGKLFVSNREIAKGSNGTVIYEGIYEGRKVAVKRLVQAHHDMAFKEIQNLIASDQHPNVIRWYGVEYDHGFVYLSLELCSCSLNDLIESYADFPHNSISFGDQSLHAKTEYKIRLNSVQATMQDIKLWKNNGHPSALLLKLMRDVVSGIVHLHELGIIHRDLKPQNVLIKKDKTLCAKLSDMGISKRLLADMSSLGHHATGHGSSGWQPREQLLHGRQTRAVDIFSLGCVLFFCVTGGQHPFGDRFERDANIIRDQMDLFLVENMPEALELFSRLLQPDPEKRPKAQEVLHHPFFWNSEMRLSFLHDASDRVELEDRETNSNILKALESVGSVAIGTKWNEKLEPQFIDNIGRYRRYKYDSVRDLLRVMRNKLNHYRELPAEIQGLLGHIPDGFEEYFSSRFPRLLIEVYKVLNRFCRSEPWFQKYVQGSML